MASSLDLNDTHMFLWCRTRQIEHTGTGIARSCRIRQLQLSHTLSAVHVLWFEPLISQGRLHIDAEAPARHGGQLYSHEHDLYSCYHHLFLCCTLPTRLTSVIVWLTDKGYDATRVAASTSHRHRTGSGSRTQHHTHAIH